MTLERTFTRLSDAQREALFAVAETRTYGSGEVIFKQGQPFHGIYAVISGEVDIERGFKVVRETVTKAPDGKTQRKRVPGTLSVVMSRRGPGALFGAMSFAEGQPMSATATAVGEAEVLYLADDKVRALTEQDTAFAAGFYHSLAIALSQRLREINRRPRRANGTMPKGATANAEPVSATVST